MARDEADKTGRRGALAALAIVSGAATCAAIFVPGAEMLLAPAASGGGKSERWVKTVRLHTLRDGVPQRVAIVDDRRDAWTMEKMVELGAVWLVRNGDGVECFSVTCPHLGCAIGSNETGFFCPCHDSDFAKDGKRLGGPSPRDLDRLATKVEGGYVLVDFRRYRQGTSDLVEIG